MGGITKQEQASSIPTRQTIGFHGEHGNLFPVGEFGHTVSKIWRALGNPLAQGRESGGMDLVIRSLADDVADLPVLFAFEEKQGTPTTKMRHEAMRIFGLA